LLRVEEGKAVLDGVEHHIKPRFAILVPAGTRHNIINGLSGLDEALHALRRAQPSRRRRTPKADAETDEDYFDGKTTE
jgi:hypothetical protein